MVTLDRQVDTIDSSDLLKPEIRLIQSVGGDKAKEAGAKPGQFYNQATSEIYPDGFEFVVLDIQKGRTYWGRDTLGDEPPLCASTNAKSYESVNGEDCHKCEHLCDNAAMLDAKTRREKCCPNYTIMGMMADSLTPFILRATGISATPVSSLLTQIMYNKAAHNPENPARIDWHKFKITVSGVEQKARAGTAYALHFKNLTMFGDPEFENQMFVNSAILLGQGHLLELPEGQQQTTAALPAAPPVPAPAQQTPKVNVVTPPAKPAQAAAPAAPEKPRPKMDMDI